MSRSFLAFLMSLALAALAQAQGESTCVVVGRLELPDGSPAVGASLSATAESPSESFPIFQATSGPDGQFRLELAAPPGNRYLLDGYLPGYPRLAWDLEGLVAGTTKDLGEVRIAEPCYIVGRIQDREQRACIEGWTALGVSRAEGSGGHRWREVRARPRQRTSTFRIGPFPPGPVTLSTKSLFSQNTESVTCIAKAGEVAQAVLHYNGPLVGRRITVSTSAGRYSGFGQQPFSGPGGGRDTNLDLVLLDAGGRVVDRARPVEGKRDVWEFTDLPRQEYVLELRDRRYEPQRLEPVRPGKHYRLNLVGSAALDPRVLDASGEPVEAFGLRICYPDLGVQTHEHQIRQDGVPRPPSVILGVVPGRVLLEVTRNDGTTLRQTIGSVEPGTTREVTLRFGDERDLQGQVLYPDGSAAAGVTVEYTRGPLAGLTSGYEAWIGSKSERRRIGNIEGSVQTEEDGRFVIPGLSKDQWTLRALDSPFIWASATVEHPGTSNAVALTLPAAGVVRGQMLYPPGFDIDGLALAVSYLDRSAGDSVLSDWAEPPQIGPDG